MLILIIFCWTKNHMKTVFIVYKTSLNAKPSRIIFYEVNDYIKKCDQRKYLTLYPSNKKYDRILIELDILLC